MKLLTFILLTMSMVLNACSPFVITSSSGKQPEPIVGFEPAVTNEAPAPIIEGNYQLIQVDDVSVEVGVGSPIPVHVSIDAQLPDTCGQVEYVEQKQDGTNFIINVFTLPATDESCLRDTVPFRMVLPLNAVALQIGEYSVEVNGVHADFRIAADTSTAILRTADMPLVKDDIQVDHVGIQVGVGSPIPVHAIVSANLPKACAQLNEVRMHRDGNIFFVRLIADAPAQTDCADDTLPIRLEIPLNLINLPDGTYEVNINGTVGTFSIPVQ